MLNEISLLEILNEALGYCEAQDYELISTLITKKLQNPTLNTHPRVKYIKAISINLHQDSNTLKDEDYDAQRLKLLCESCNLGVPEAQYELGNDLYEAGQYEEAVTLYSKSAEQGYPPALYTYGLDLYNGIGGEMDKPKGLKYIKMAAGLLNVNALEFLIELYSNAKTLADREIYDMYSLMLSWAD